MARPEDGKISTDQLRAEREKAAEALLAARYGDPKHAALEAKFNDIEKQIFILAGGHARDYKYKYDVRHYFDLREEGDPTDHTKIKQIATMAHKPDGTLYTMRPPDEVINWRNTNAGAKADDANRRAKNRGSLDDAGHLIALEYGTSPSEQRNLADQNYIQNEWGTWRQQEKQLGAFISSHPDCRVRVEVNYFRDQYGQRSLYWRMKAADANNLQSNDNLVFLNSQSNYANRGAGAQHMQEIRKVLADCEKSGFSKPDFRIV